ncbi:MULTISPECIES: response regulator [unclassified Bradyrhizobium]|uniref:response regulator n=1 Tax=unclassified Bradyrhizobium TaxID=2631580 RepID=UPI0023068087|nr:MULTISPECIES: response regulator [unclassified Bradyrhizobium]MDA9415117.1 chemotaxis protein CheY [Bradyrhizobium sp. CCBAU 25360]MDA9448720.1 chemotaxis protein CheY [Bradyrhizobium sp. CCBAU 21360]MDA9454024.1 chemotaxis protein CheY [Bradyrhizobium sp. CCBAU 21359]MDA9515037.1 chemotaxis protein CheY [Bradyrhizobium sp. CCBAU 11430]
MASVLLIEDEALIQMMIADMLAELGHTVVAEASDLASALQHANQAEFDFAVVDVLLGHTSSEPVAVVLAERNIPFAFASGYEADGIPDGFQDRPLLTKPFQIDQLERCIAKLMDRR